MADHGREPKSFVQNLTSMPCDFQLKYAHLSLLYLGGAVRGQGVLCQPAFLPSSKCRSQPEKRRLMTSHQLLRDFQGARPGTKEHILALIELLARSCHEIAARIFQLDEGVHKHALYEAWRDAQDEDLLKPGCKRPPCTFSNTEYQFYEQYPNGIADVAGYWAESKIFGGVVVFDRGPSGVEVGS